MDYSDVLKRAWRTLWHAWGIWGFLASFLPVFAVLAAVIAGVVAFTLVGALDGSGEVGSVLALLAVAAGVSLLSVPLGLTMHGGLIALTFEAQEGRPAGVGVGWRGGLRSLPRLFVFDVLLFLLVAVVFGVIGGAFAGALALFASGNDESVLPIILTICFGYVVFFVLALVATIVLFGFESLGARFAVIDGLSGLDAFAAAFATFRSRAKQVLAMALILMGVQWGVGMALSLVVTPLEFLGLPLQSLSEGAPEPTLEPRFFIVIGVIYLISLLVQVPLMIFFYSAWTAFFRKLTGRDTDAAVTPPPALDAGLIPPPPSVAATPRWREEPPEAGRPAQEPDASERQIDS